MCSHGVQVMAHTELCSVCRVASVFVGDTKAELQGLKHSCMLCGQESYMLCFECGDTVLGVMVVVSDLCIQCE